MKYIGLALIVTICYGCNLASNNNDSSTSKDSDHQDKKQPITLSPEEFKAGIKNDDAVVLDVRTQQEFEKGHLPQAKNVNYRAPDFETLIKQIDREGSFYVYCASGKRSSKAADFMAKEGFDEVYSLKNGILNWQKQGYPVKQ